jgi:hypothetical protein
MIYTLKNCKYALLMSACVFLFNCKVSAKGFSDTLGVQAVKNLSVKKASKSQLSDIDQLLNQQHFDFSKNETGFSEDFFAKFNAPANVQIEKYRDTARSVISELESTNNFVEFLTPSDLSKLPVGFKKRIGTTEVTIAVSNIIFTPRFAELTVFARIKIPQSPNTIFFGIKGLKLSNNGGIIGDAKLVLLGDLAIPINGRNSALVLKGGFDINTGQSVDKTYITMDCSGFKKLRIDADVEFPRSILLPVNAAGDIDSDINNRVKGSFSTEVSNWNDILASFSLSSFQVKGLKDIIFNINTAAFDFSDYRNSDNIVYPAGYQQKYLNANAPELWRGVYVKDLNVSLPRGFKDKTTSQRVSFGVNDMIIDNNGLTGIFYAENVLPLKKGNAGGWKFSVDSIRLAIEANSLQRASFGGKIGIPFSKDQNTTDTLNKKKYLSYGASISYNGDYVLNIRTQDSLQFDIWKAEVLLEPNSWVQLKYENNVFKPEAMLNGSMGMNIKNTSDTSNARDNKAAVADFKGVKFQGLNIKSEAPYVSAQYFGYQGELKLANFPLSIENISLRNISANEVGIAFNAKITLQDGDFTGSTGVTIVGTMDDDQGIKSWKYTRLKIDSVTIHANVKNSFQIDGYVKFMDADPVYGDGWKGGISAKFTKGFASGFDVSVNAVFGKTTYRYWYIDGKVSFPGSGISCGFININGFGGGAYYKMKKNGFSNTPSAFTTGVNYIPDSTTSLGVKAAIYFNVIKKSLANGEASFEIAFNSNGGLKYLGIFGYGRVMAEIPGISNVADYVSDKFKKCEIKTAASGKTLQELDNLKLFQSTNAAQITYDAETTPGQVGLEAYLGIQYDFNSSTLHATFDMYVNAAAGFIQGAASGNRAGWAVLHIAPDKWYLHAGTPTDKLGIVFGVGPFRIRTGAYFMLGHDIPAFPPPPPIVVSILNQAGLNYVPPAIPGDIANGTGVAFGASIDVNTGDVRFLMLYARFQAGLGFDLMLKKWDNSIICAETGQQIGLKGWWAEGQAYAYLQGELGIRIKIGFFRKNISLIRGSAAALVEAKLPNPTWFRANIAVNVRILGLININVGFKFTVGHLCTFANNGDPGNGENPYDEEIKSIETITPENNATGKSLFIKPQIKFQVKPGQEITMDNPDGPPDVYRPVLEYCKIVTAAGVEVPTEKVYNSAGDLLTLKLNETLNANSSYKVMTKIAFYVKRGNQYSWIPLTHDGVRIEEVSDVVFSTGVGVDSIPIENCNRMYPFPEEKFVYPGETTSGSVQLNVGVSSIFSQAPAWKARFINVQTGVEAGFTTSTYDAGTKKISFGIPPTLPASTNYRLEITKASFVTGSGDSSKPALTYKFKTSAYNTLAQKIQALQTVQGIVGRVSSDVINLQSKVAEYEGFESAELIGNNYTNNQPLIRTEAILSDSFYLGRIAPLIYRTVPLADSLGYISFTITNRNTSLMGVPPVKAINVSSYYINSLDGYYGNFSKIRLPFIYNLPYYYSRDFNDLKSQVVNYYLQGLGGNTTGSWICTGGGNGGPVQNEHNLWGEEIPVETVGDEPVCIYVPNVNSQTFDLIPPIFRPLVASPFPFMPNGTYKIKIQYLGVDNVPGTFGEYNFLNPIE